MGRKSKLSEEQWLEAERRHLLNGESIRSIARDLAIDEKALRQRINPQKSACGDSPKPLKQLAQEKLAAESAVKSNSAEIAALTPARQMIVSDLANKLANISGHLASAAEYGAMTAHRLAGIANQQIQKVNDADPLAGDSVEILKGVGALTTLANQSAQLGMNLLQANKEAAGGGNSGLNDKLSELIEKLPG